MTININGINWEIMFVSYDNPILWIPTGYALGVTDVFNKCIYIANDLNNEKLYDVWIHELTHAWMYSYGYDIDIPCEEIICQVVEKYGDDIQDLADRTYREI